MKKILIAFAIATLFASNACAIMFAPARITVKAGKTVSLTAINHDIDTTIIRLRFEYEQETKPPNVPASETITVQEQKKPVITVYPKMMTLKPGTNRIFNITPKVPGKYKIYLDNKIVHPGEEVGEENIGKGGGQPTFINMRVPMEVTE